MKRCALLLLVTAGTTVLLSNIGCAPVQDAGGALAAADLARWENPPPPPAVTSPGAKDYSLPVEATIESKRRHRAEFMNASQVAAGLRAGQDIAILPVGPIKPSGLDMPMGSSLLVSHAAAVLLAQRWGAIAFPPTPYGCASESRSQPGAVSIALDDQMAYVRGVAQSLLLGGFRRVVIVGDPDMRDDLIALACSIYRQTGIVVLPLTPSVWPKDANVLPKGLSDPAAAEPLKVLAAMEILGHPGLTGEYRFAETQSQPVAAQALEALRKNGLSAPESLAGGAAQPAAAGKTFSEADVAGAVEIMRNEAKKADELPTLLAKYQAEIRSQDLARPWAIENWPASVAASHGDVVPPWTAPPARPRAEGATTSTVRMDLPEEAQPAAIRKHRAEFLTAREMAQAVKDQRVAILPAGCFEMHGPHGLLGTDTIEAYSQALVVAKPWNAVVLPPIYYTFSGATERWPGTVGVSPEGITRYVKAVASGLLDAGFRSVVILWVHGPGRYSEQAVVREIQQERGRTVFSAQLGMWRGDELEKALGYSGGEDIAALAGVKLMGHPGVFAVDEPADVGVIKLPFHTIVELNAMGTRQPWNMGLPTHHLAVRKCVRSGDEDKMIPVMREAAAAVADGPKAMLQYLDEMEKARPSAAP